MAQRLYINHYSPCDNPPPYPPTANDSVTERASLTGGKTAKYLHWQT